MSSRDRGKLNRARPVLSVWQPLVFTPVYFWIKQVRTLAWLLACSIVVLSVVPPPLRPVSPAPHGLEHFLIFFTMATAVGLSYLERPLLIAVALLGFTGVVELVQLGIPGRHGRFSDFIIDALGCAGGLTFALIIARIAQRVSRAV